MECYGRISRQSFQRHTFCASALNEDVGELTLYAMILCDDKGAFEKKDNPSMTNFERCGNDVPDNLAICPNCGTVTSKAKDKISPTTSYGSFTDAYYNQVPLYTESNQQNVAPPFSQENNLPQQNVHYGQT